MTELAKWLEAGVEAGYDPWNWAKGMPVSVFIDSAESHLNKIKKRTKDGENHPAALLFNVMALVHTLQRIETGVLPGTYDDRPYWGSSINDSNGDTHTRPDYFSLSPEHSMEDNENAES
jgi:hypothetical protein